MSRDPLALVCLFSVALAAAAPTAGAAMLQDSTSVEAWRLGNGLEVRVRDVPGAGSVAITLAYRAGTFLDPADRPDLAALLAQVQFTAPAGEIPERALGEMSSVRPLGWGVTTNPHLALLTEVASADRFAGVLHEVALRARGVRTNDSCVAHALAGVRRSVGESRYGGDVEAALYERVRDLALGLDEAQLLDRSRGRGLARITRVQVDTLLKRYYCAANASLALVGDFSAFDLHALLEREFGGIPPGVAQPDPPAERLSGAVRASIMPGLSASRGVMGVFAPAIEDTLHPAFYLNALILGGWWSRQAEDAGSSLRSHFQYSLFDEPELARFDFDVRPGPVDLKAQALPFDVAVEEFARLLLTGEIHELFRRNVEWLLGGPMGPQLRRQANNTPSILSTIATTTATRAIWKGDAFWARYLDRFETARFGATTFLRWLKAPEHQALLVLQPRP